jgi:hypothetical protein
MKGERIMDLPELEYLYQAEIDSKSALSYEEKWFQVWYSQFDRRADIIHHK